MDDKYINFSNIPKAYRELFQYLYNKRTVGEWFRSRKDVINGAEYFINTEKFIYPPKDVNDPKTILSRYSFPWNNTTKGAEFWVLLFDELSGR